MQVYQWVCMHIGGKQFKDHFCSFLAKEMFYMMDNKYSHLRKPCAENQEFISNQNLLFDEQMILIFSSNI